jgi:hypothetical protein
MSSDNHHLDEWAALVGADLPEDVAGGRHGRDDASTDATGFDAR